MNVKRFFCGSCAGLFLLSLGACQNPGLIRQNHQVAEVLQQALHLDAGLDRHHPLITTSFANIDNLDESSTLGRVLGEQIGSYFTRQGYRVIELRLRNAVLIREGTGELMLSREVQAIGQQHKAQAVITGTYALGANEVYVSAKLIRAKDGVVAAAYDYALPLDANLRALVRNDRTRRTGHP